MPFMGAAVLRTSLVAPSDEWKGVQLKFFVKQRLQRGNRYKIMEVSTFHVSLVLLSGEKKEHF